MKVMKNKEKGVSEVLGSILVLLITVTLFSSVFYYVSTLPTPKSGTYSEFDARLQFVNITDSSGTHTYANITVKNVGGESLPADKTMFIVVIDAVVNREMLSAMGQSFASDNYFSQGESFYYNSSSDGVTVTETSTIAIMLYDKANSRVIWSETLHGKMNLPGIVVGVMSNPMPIVLGKYASIRAIVFDPDIGDDVSTYEVGVDLSSLNESSYVKMKYAGNNLFVTQQIMFHDTSLDTKKTYKVIVYVKDNMGRNVSYSGYLYVSHGNEAKGADVFIDPSMITLSDGSPTHMSDVTVTVTVQNRGGTGATFKLEVIDRYEGYPGGEIYIDTNVGDPMPNNGTYSVAAAGQTVISFIWKKVGSNESGVSMGRVSGNHHLIIRAIQVQGVDGSAEEDNYPNTADLEITVLPKILFVDADQAIEGTTNDVSKYYQYLLNTCDYEYTTKRIMGDTVLTYDGTLRNYDLVVWETGYFGDSVNVSAVSPQQMPELYTYYSNGGSLWLTSPETSDSVMSTFGLHVAKFQYNDKFTGVPNPDINLTLPNGKQIEDTLVTDRSTTSNRADVMHVSGASALIDDKNGNVLAVYMQNSRHGKFVYMGFEFSRIRNYYAQNFIGYRILLWLGNITGRVGVDVAVDDLLLSTEHPLYMQNVTISVVVSNNGEKDISTDVLLKIDGVKSPDIITFNPNSTGPIPGNGGFVYVNFTWVPKSPGMHEIEVYVDPYNLIKETNEENNMLDTSILNTVIYVEFSTLIIYNTTTANANTTDAHLTTLIQAFNDLGYAFQELNVHDPLSLPSGYADGTYFTRYNLVIWVQVAPCNPGTSDNYIGHRDAQAIFYSVQRAPVGFMFLGPKMPEVLQYAEYNTNQNLLNDLYGVQIAGNGLTSGSYVLFGYNSQNSITNGLAYVVQTNAPSGSDADLDLLTGTNAQSYALFRDPSSVSTSLSDLESTYIQRASPAMQGYGIATYSTQSTKAMIVPFDTSKIIGIFGLKYKFKPVEPAEQARAQFLFHMLRWFGQLELRPELAVYEPEIEIQSELPQIMVGHSYMLRTTIHNFGDAGASVVVRFYDDYEWIGSKSVFVPANNESTVEIVWTPMFASHARHIRIVVDPLNEVKEISTPALGEVLAFNNEAVMTKTVWYFWDNMEYGTQNWEHDATLVNINGETPLDFLARKDVDTNVIGDWDWSYSGVTDNSYHATTGSSVLGNGIYMTNDNSVTNFTHGAAHTQPSAYWLPETTGTAIIKRDIDVIMTFDFSGSMSWDEPTRLYGAKAAAGIFVDTLHDNDRAALAKFNSQSYLVDRFTNNHGTIRNDILTLYPNDGTAFLDATAVSVRYAAGVPSSYSWAHNFNHNDHNTNNFPAAIVLTDGQSNSDNTFTTYQSCINEITKYNVALFTIAFGGDADRANMWRLAYAMNHTGQSFANYSMHFNVSNANDLIKVFKEISEVIHQGASGGIRAPPGKDVITVYTEDFENGMDGWSAGGTSSSWGVDDPSSNSHYWVNRAHSGSKCAATGVKDGRYKKYKDGEDSWFRSPLIDLTPYPNMTIKLSFWAAYDFYEYSTPWGYYDYYDHSLLEVSQDGGNTWSIVHSFPDENGNSNARLSSWTNYEIDLSPYAGKQIYLRFKMQDDDNDVYSSGYTGNDRNHGIYIDDITITAESSGGGGTGGSPYSIEMEKYRFLTTPAISVNNAEKATLSFWTKYWMTEGTNGGVIYIWGKKAGESSWTWDKDHRIYIKPTQPYSGNLLFSGVDNDADSGGLDGSTGLRDMFGNLPYWCFNGRSGGGTFNWKYIEADITPYLSYFSEIRFVFIFAQYGGLSANNGWHPEMGWYLDDVMVKVTGDSSYDLWRYTNLTAAGDTARSGNYAWTYKDANGNLPQGIDSALTTKQIDLTSARNATLDFWIRFNLDPSAGLPPATVRVEVSSDNGVTWKSITYGVRIGWGSSGHGGYAGTLDGGGTGYGWVNSHTLLRINCDLSGWAGHSVLLRFRVVTNASSAQTWDPSHANDPHGVYLDDVFISGESYAATIPEVYLWY